MGEGEQRLRQLAAVEVRRKSLGAELDNFLASVSASKLVASQEDFTYEEQHRQDPAAVEGGRRQQQDQAGRVLRRAEGEELPLYSSLQRRQEELGDLRLEEVVGLLLPLVVLEEAVVHLKRRQVVWSMLADFFCGLLRYPGVWDGVCLTVAALLLHQEV